MLTMRTAEILYHRMLRAEGAVTGNAAAYPQVMLRFLLGGILAIAVALDVFRLGARSLWLDESASVAFAHLAWKTLGGVLQHGEANMALYYGLLHLWVGAFGDSEFTVRILSALFAVGGVSAVYALGLRMFDARVGLIAALLMAVNAYHVMYGQEARSYSLLVLLVTLSSLAFLRTLERPGWKNISLYTVASVLAVYAHFFAVLVLAAQWLSLTVLKRRSTALKAVFASAAVMCMALVPLGLAALGGGGQINWISKPNLRAIVELFYALTGSSPTGAKPLLLAYFIACSGAVIVGIREFADAPLSFPAWRYGFLATWFIAPIVLTLGISIIKPVFVPYYLIILLPPLVLLAAVGISRVPVKSGTAAVLLIMLAMAGYEDAHYLVSSGREDWRGATEYAASGLKRGDALVFYPAFLQVPFDYYRVRVFSAGESPVIVFPRHWSWARIANGGAAEEPSDALLRSLPAHYTRIWLLSREGEAGPHLLSLLQADYGRGMKKSFGAVKVTVYSLAH